MLTSKVLVHSYWFSPVRMKQSLSGFRTSQVHFDVRVVAPSELSSRDRQAWIELESRAAEPNAYLSPHFVLPAARYLDPHNQPLLFLTERVVCGQRDLIGVAVLQRSPATRLFPVGHLVAYQSRHTFLSGLLLDREWVHDALAALLEHIRCEPSHRGLELPEMWADGSLAQALGELDIGACLHQDVERGQRAVLRPADAGPKMLQAALGKRMKDLDRRMRRLNERGEVGWRYHREGGIPDNSVEAFLTLEHAGWKGEQGSSMRSAPADERFFREVVTGFGAEGRALFLELTLDGEAIASISNFISGSVGFGFKIGWNPAFKAFSPGVLNEVEFIREAPQAFADISYFDSGASANSFMDALWPVRRPLATATVPTSSVARLMTDSASSARHFKRGWRTNSLHPIALHANKPEWILIASESFSSLAMLF